MHEIDILELQEGPNAGKSILRATETIASNTMDSGSLGRTGTRDRRLERYWTGLRFSKDIAEAMTFDTCVDADRYWTENVSLLARRY